MNIVPKKITIEKEAFEFDGIIFENMDDFDKYLEEKELNKTVKELMDGITEKEVNLIVGSCYQWVGKLYVTDYNKKSINVDFPWNEKLSSGYYLSKKGEKLARLYNMVGLELTFTSDVEGFHTKFPLKKTNDTDMTKEELLNIISVFENRDLSLFEKGVIDHEN